MTENKYWCRGEVPSYNLVANTHIDGIFSDRNWDVIQGILEGKSNCEIAQELNISTEAVKNYLSGAGIYTPGIFRRLEDRFDKRPESRTHLIKILIEKGFVNQEPINPIGN